MKGYYFVSDSELSMHGILSDAENAVRAGACFIQYREKNADTGRMCEEAALLGKICSGSSSLFIVNDRIDVALASAADGVHLGQSDMPLKTARKILGSKKIIGVTAHSPEEAIIAEKDGADYLGVSPIFPTYTKGDAGNPCGIEILKEIKKNSSIPVAAIGGINFSNLDKVIEAGADMVCMISAVIAEDPVFKKMKEIQGRFGL
jgi:thiamine-phosphate pyrophosphorylase